MNSDDQRVLESRPRLELIDPAPEFAPVNRKPSRRAWFRNSLSNIAHGSSAPRKWASVRSVRRNDAPPARTPRRSPPWRLADSECTCLRLALRKTVAMSDATPKPKPVRRADEKSTRSSFAPADRIHHAAARGRQVRPLKRRMACLRIPQIPRQPHGNHSSRCPIAGRREVSPPPGGIRAATFRIDCIRSSWPAINCRP